MTTKRTSGLCTCSYAATHEIVRDAKHHPDCPSLYHAPQQEPDALTRLVRTVRALDAYTNHEKATELMEQALSLISEAREAQRKARADALEEAAQTAGDAAAAWDDKNGGIDAKTGPRIAEICKDIRSLKP